MAGQDETVSYMTEQERRIKLGRVIEGMLLSRWRTLVEAAVGVGLGRTTLYNLIAGNPNPRKGTFRSLEFELGLPKFSLDYVIQGDYEALASLPIDQKFDSDTKRLLVEIVNQTKDKVRTRQTGT